MFTCKYAASTYPKCDVCVQREREEAGEMKINFHHNIFHLLCMLRMMNNVYNKK
jgi:hypothetical protein